MRMKFSPFHLLLPLLVGGVFAYNGMYGTDVVYDVHAGTATSTKTQQLIGVTETATSTQATTPEVPAFVVTHIAPPSPVKGAYMTSCIASGKNLRAPLVKLVEENEMNALIIDIKDYTGTISFETGDPRFILNSKGCSISDIQTFIASLHEKHIYVIGRVQAMQDASYPKLHPDAAVKRKSDGKTWSDRKGITFVDPGASEYWAYLADLARASYAVGFDEINFDYVRFPSDGNMSDIAFTRTGSTSKPEMMRRFYDYLGHEMHKAGIPISADLFGMTTTNADDLGIGQVLENALPNFDYIAPMVYPSHYPPNFNGWKDPNKVPYDIVNFSMAKAVARANALEEKEAAHLAALNATGTSTGTSTQPKFIPTGKYANKLRPWLQDNDYPVTYTAEMVRAQIKATYDAGLTSWMMWDPRNVYTKAAYQAP